MPRRKNSEVKISFVKVNAAARRARQTHRYKRTTLVNLTNTPIKADERSMLDLWMEIIPDGITPLDWLRAWQDGFPEPMAVDAYNRLHPDENEQFMLEEDDEDA